MGAVQTTVHVFGLAGQINTFIQNTMLKSTNLQTCKTEQKVSFRTLGLLQNLILQYMPNYRKMLHNLVLKQQNTQSFVCGGRVLWNGYPMEVPSIN